MLILVILIKDLNTLVCQHFTPAFFLQNNLSKFTTREHIFGLTTNSINKHLTFKVKTSLHTQHELLTLSLNDP
jgi:hypothetical protein